MERRSLVPIIRRRDYRKVEKFEGGIVIDNVTVNLTLKNVNVGYGTDIIDDAAGILLKGKAKLKFDSTREKFISGYIQRCWNWVEKMQHWLLRSRVPEA